MVNSPFLRTLIAALLSAIWLISAMDGLLTVMVYFPSAVSTPDAVTVKVSNAFTSEGTPLIVGLFCVPFVKSYATPVTSSALYLSSSPE